MSLIVPQGVSDVVGATLLLVDYPDDFTGQATVNSSGAATISTDAVDPDYYWRIERLTTAVANATTLQLVTPPAGALLMCYKGNELIPGAFRDGSQSPGLDVADMSQPITLRPGEQLTFSWTGLAPGTIAYGTAQYSLYLRVIGA